MALWEATQVYFCSGKAAIESMKTSGRGYFPIKLYLQTTWLPLLYQVYIYNQQAGLENELSFQGSEKRASGTYCSPWYLSLSGLHALKDFWKTLQF